MARPSTETETRHQEPESSTKTTSEQTARRESYLAGDPDSAPELVRFMGCKTITDIGKFSEQDLLTAATQASQTISGWEVTIVAQDEQILDLQAQIQDLQNQTQDQQTVLRYLNQNRPASASPSPIPAPSKSTKIPDPEPLSDGKTPTFENWKIQIQNKFVINHDHFSTDQ